VLVSEFTCLSTARTVELVDEHLRLALSLNCTNLSPGFEHLTCFVMCLSTARTLREVDEQLGLALGWAWKF
jgi:hypothetical protein